MSLDKFEACMRSINEHRAGDKGATCPRPDTLRMRFDGLNKAQRNDPVNVVRFDTAVRYATRVHNALTQDPNKDTAQMNKLPTNTVTHRFATEIRGVYSFMTGGKVMELHNGGIRASVRWPNGKYGTYLTGNLSVDEPLPVKVAPEAAHAFNGNQYAILAALFTGQKRTDVLASAMGSSNPASASHEALPLREKGLVTTTNDGQPYVIWTLTAHGLFVAGEIERRKKEQKAEQERLAQEHAAAVAAKAKKAEWIIWSPESNLPPKVRYSCEQEAMAVAESMAKRYPGQSFIACELHAGFKVVKVQKERVVIDTVDKAGTVLTIPQPAGDTTMLLKLAALLAAISHTLHDTMHELRSDAALHQRSIPLVKRMRANEALERANQRAAVAEESAMRLARATREAASRTHAQNYKESVALEEAASKKAIKLDAKAQESADKRAKAQAIIDLIKA